MPSECPKKAMQENNCRLEVVASTVTDNSGNAKFKRVVTTEGYYANYAYYIYFEFSKDDKYNYELPHTQSPYTPAAQHQNIHSKQATITMN
jgi:hypothetical protein